MERAQSRQTNRLEKCRRYLPNRFSGILTLFGATVISDTNQRQHCQHQCFKIPTHPPTVSHGVSSVKRTPFLGLGTLGHVGHI
jgi:hypothetical protein